MTNLIGKKVIAVQPLTAAMAEWLGWGSYCGDATILIFDDGTILVPMQDAEGNGPGSLMTVHLRADKFAQMRKDMAKAKRAAGKRAQAANQA